MDRIIEARLRLSDIFTEIVFPRILEEKVRLLTALEFH